MYLTFPVQNEARSAEVKLLDLICHIIWCTFLTNLISPWKISFCIRDSRAYFKVSNNRTFHYVRPNQNKSFHSHVEHSNWYLIFDIILGLFRVFRFPRARFLRVLKCLEWFNNIKLCFIASVMKQYVRLLDTLVYYYYMCQVGRGRCKGWLVWKESAC